MWPYFSVEMWIVVISVAWAADSGSGKFMFSIIATNTIQMLSFFENILEGQTELKARRSVIPYQSVSNRGKSLTGYDSITRS